MPTSPAALSKLIDSVYASALDATRWPEFLEKCSEHFRGANLTLHSHDLLRGKVIQAHSLDNSEECMDAYRSYYANLNPLPNLAAHRFPVGLVYKQDQLRAFSELRGTEYFEDFMKPWGLEDSISVTLRSDERIRIGLSIQAPRKILEQSSNDWIDLMNMLSPHIVRATQMNRLLLDYDCQIKSAELALDTIKPALFVLNPQGEIKSSNLSGERLLKESEFLKLGRSKRLQFNDRSKTRLLREALHKFSSQAEDSHCSKVQFTLQDSSGHMCYQALLLPQRKDQNADVLSFYPEVSGQYFGLLYVLQFGPVAQDGGGQLMQLFGWSRAEASLALALANGETPATYAEQSEISINTVRTLLRRAMDKAHINRQAVLIQLVTQALGVLQPPSSAGN